MECIVDSVFFSFIDPPNVRVSYPRWLTKPSPMQVFALFMVAYFFVAGGIIFDIINEPPGIGQTTDSRGNAKPVAIMPYRVNGQYIMEGLAASFMFSLGGIGFIILDNCNNPLTPKFNRIMMLGLSFACILISFFATRVFLKIKLPYYMQGYFLSKI